MAGFVEQATLKVNDQSSAAIRKINAELKKLDQTARSLKSTTINIRINDRGIQQATRALQALHRQLSAMGAARINLSVNTNGLTRAASQLQRLRSQASRPINVNTGGGGAAGGAGGRGRAPPGTAQTGIRHQFGNFSALRGAASVLVGGTAYALGAEFMKAVKEGSQEVDTGRTSLLLKQLDRVYGEGAQYAADGMIAAAQDKATTLRGGAFWNMGQRTQNFSEALGITQARDTRPGRGRPSGQPEYRPALAITSQLEEMSRILVGLGQSSEKATEQAMNFAKGLEQTGRFTDRLTGAFDTNKMQESFDFFRQLMPTIGKEFSGDFSRQMIKYLSTEKYTVSNRALGAVMLMGEEMGTRAAVGYHQAVKQLGGQGQKKPQMAFMLEEGLLTTTGTKTVGKGRRAKQVPIVGDTVDSDMLKTDLPQWIDKHLVPILEKRGRAEAKALVESGEISTSQFEAYVEKYKTDPTKISALAYKVVGDRTAIETVAGFLERSQEIQRQLNESALRSGKPEDVRKATEFSINIATAQLGNQFRGAMGQMAQSSAPWLVPQMQRASTEFSKISTDFADAQRRGEVPLNAMQRLSDAFTPVAIGAAIATAVSDPTKAPMAMASIGLITAGNLLMKAANKIIGTPEDPTKGPFGRADTPEGFRLEDVERQLVAARSERDAMVKAAKQSEQSIEEDRREIKKYEATKAAGKRITQGREQQIAAAKGRVESYDASVAAGTIESLNKKVFDLESKVTALRYETITGKKYEEKQELYDKARKEEAAAAEEERVRVKAMTKAQRKAYWAAKEKQTPMPRPRPPDIVEDRPPPDFYIPPPPEPPPLPPELTPPLKVEPVAPGISGSGIPPIPPPIIPLRPVTDLYDMEPAKVQFASLFTSGASTIGESGRTVGSNAASELSGEAGGIGGAIGRAAAAIISAATVNVQIPSQSNPGTGNTGRSTVEA